MAILIAVVVTILMALLIACDNVISNNTSYTGYTNIWEVFLSAFYRTVLSSLIRTNTTQIHTTN